MSSPDPFAVQPPDAAVGQAYSSGPPRYGQFPVASQRGWEPAGPPGKVRGTGVAMLLYVITFGIYGLFWFYATSKELKQHSGQGLGGGVALLIAVFLGFASPFITSSEVGEAYERRGQARPVSGVTGLWVIPGFLLLVGPVVWFVKTNGALNAYWRSVGAQG